MNKKQRESLKDIKPNTRKYTKAVLEIEAKNKARRKKILTVLLVLLVIAGAFFTYWMLSLRYTASNMIGTWKATTCEYSGQTMDVESLYGKFNIVLKANGKCSMVTGSYKVNGKWAPTWNLKGFKFVSSSDDDEEEADPLVFEKKGKNKIVLEESGLTYTFERKTSK